MTCSLPSGRALEDAAAVLREHGLEPVQVAWHVPEPEAAARSLAAAHGWGPFYLLEHVPLAWCRYRGRATDFDHSSAYGQAGELMLELITDHGSAPSVVRERFAPQESGLHHLAAFVPDLDRAVAALRERQHWQEIFRAEAEAGVVFAMLDAVEGLGALLELYEPDEALAGFYRTVAAAARGWQGDRPVRRPRSAPQQQGRGTP